MIDLEKEGIIKRGKRKGEEKIARGIKDEISHTKYKNVDDISLLSPEYEMETTKAHQFLTQRNPNKTDINRLIPVVKHYETCEDRSNLQFYCRYKLRFPNLLDLSS